IYSEAKEEERKAAEALKTALRLEEEAAKAKERAQIASLRSKAKSLIKKRWFEKYHWFYSSENVLVVSGKDASQNESLAKKYGTDSFTILHADFTGASLTVITAPHGERTLTEASQFAASYSRAWQAGVTAVDVFYATGAKVSTSPPSGEFLAKGGIIFHEKNYVKSVPLRIALGLRSLDDGERRICSYPPDSMCGESFAVLEPGDTDRNTIAKRVLKMAVASFPELDYVKTLRTDDILPLVPGPSRITRPSQGSAFREV
ncbi:MAG: NFACT RNA binding domain-containing protein, partial [Thermoprotei archaeon]